MKFAKYLAIALSSMVLAPQAALACSCMFVKDESAIEESLTRIAARAVAVGEFEVIDGSRDYSDPNAQQAGFHEKLRPISLVIGDPNRDYDLYRNGAVSSAACGVTYQSGTRVYAALFMRDERWDRYDKVVDEVMSAGGATVMDECEAKSVQAKLPPATIAPEVNGFTSHNLCSDQFLTPERVARIGEIAGFIRK